MAFDGTAIPASLENAEGCAASEGPRPVAASIRSCRHRCPGHRRTISPATCAHANGQWIFRGIKGTVGDSDLAGDFTVDVSRKRHSTTADLTSRKFKYKDLGGFIGLPPGESTRSLRTAEQQQEAAASAR